MDFKMGVRGSQAAGKQRRLARGERRSRYNVSFYMYSIWLAGFIVEFEALFGIQRSLCFVVDIRGDTLLFGRKWECIPTANYFH